MRSTLHLIRIWNTYIIGVLSFQYTINIWPKYVLMGRRSQIIIMIESIIVVTIGLSLIYSYLMKRVGIVKVQLVFL